MNVKQIKFNKTEKIISENLDIRVEIQGLGPTIRVLRKSKISVTTERIIISQKALFGSNYIIQYIIWFKKNIENIHFKKGITEISVSPKNINKISLKGKIITELNFNDILIKYIRIFVEKDKLKISDNFF